MKEKIRFERVNLSEQYEADGRPCAAGGLECDGRRTQERTGGELEHQSPTASPRVGKLIDLFLRPIVPFCSRALRNVAAGPATVNTDRARQRSLRGGRMKGAPNRQTAAQAARPAGPVSELLATVARSRQR